MHKKSLRDSLRIAYQGCIFEVVYSNNDDNQDVSGKECLGGQTRRNSTTGVNELLVSGYYDTVTRFFFGFIKRRKGNIANHPKGNGVGRGHAPYGEI